MVLNIIISVLIFVHIFFLIALVRKNFSVIDIGWGPGIVLVALVSYLHHPLSFKNALLLMVVAIWGMRLSLYIFMRSRGKGEDPRYTKFRNDWKPHSNLQAYLKVFILQGALMLIVSLPVSSGMALESQHISWINWIGAGVWLTGFLLEVTSDHYLTWWKARPENQGKICTSGPWRLCRFPNYFGEVFLWYGIFLLSFELSNAWSIIGAFAIHFFIMKVTGIPPLEERYKNRPGYEEYSKRVPRFIPFTRP
jgi:steroid 5-alpha reductase family enzyme